LDGRGRKISNQLPKPGKGPVAKKLHRTPEHHQSDARARKLEGIVRPLREAKATLRDIAAALDKAGIETPRGGTWHPASVARLLERLDA